jgi:hypothetical protein
MVLQDTVMELFPSIQEVAIPAYSHVQDTPARQVHVKHHVMDGRVLGLPAPSHVVVYLRVTATPAISHVLGIHAMERHAITNHVMDGHAPL